MKEGKEREGKEKKKGETSRKEEEGTENFSVLLLLLKIRREKG